MVENYRRFFMHMPWVRSLSFMQKEGNCEFFDP